MRSKKTIIGAIAVSLASIMWGFDGVVLTPRLYNLNVVYVVFVLHLIPFLIMNIFLHKEYRHLKSFTSQDYLIFFLVALLGGAIGTLAIVKALFLIDFRHLTVVVLLQKLQPVFAIALAVILLKEKLKNKFILWASVAVVASYFLVFGFNLPDFNTGANTIYAALYSLLAAFSFGCSTVFSKKILLKYSFHTGTFYRYGFTTLIMLIFVSFAGKFNQFSVTTGENWMFFLIIAFTTGSGAIFLYYYGLVRIRAIIATICELFFPISAIFFDYIVNGKILSPVQWAAAVIMIFSIIKLNEQNSK
ncbi:MAG: DMT family transporter [Bacteroidetes bacterium]|nr:DMT family transporter [Bacteroidota bacterium]MBL7103824.1 DMT family transporter [Bacteroidales bacterium]